MLCEGDYFGQGLSDAHSELSLVSSTMLRLITAALLLSLPLMVEPFCRVDLPKTLEGPYGLLIPYCEYQGLKLAPGTRFEDLDRCRSVSCDKKGRLSLCGTGADAGVFGLPPGCKMVNDVCTPKMIQIPTVTTACSLLN